MLGRGYPTGKLDKYFLQTGIEAASELKERDMKKVTQAEQFF